MLKAFRNKIVQCLNELKVTNPELPDFTAALRMVTQELREEYGDSVNQALVGEGVITVKLTWSHQAKEEDNLESQTQY